MSDRDLLDASFKGVPFYVVSEELERFGRRVSNHEYPNSNEQFSEDMGGFPENFKVTGFVVGEDAKDKFSALKNACNERGTGLLILPFFGEMTMQVGECTVSVEPYINNERVQFDLEFFKSRDDAGFVPANDNAASVYALGDEAREVFADKFGALYESESVFFGITQIADIRAMISSVMNIKQFIQGTIVGKIMRQIDLISGGIAGIIADGKQVAGLFSNGGQGLFDLMSAAFIGNGTSSLITALTKESKNYTKTLSINITTINKMSDPNFTFGLQPVNFWDEDTPDRIERNNLRRTLADFYKINTLLMAYELLADTQFTTEQDSDDAKSAIEAAYIEMMHGIDGITLGSPIIEGSLFRSPFLMDEDVITAFERARLAALSATDNKNLILFKIETVDIRDYYGISCLNAAYLTQAENIKDEDDLIEMTKTMYDINGQQAYGLKGEIKVLRRIV